ncbi:MAG: DUF3592 domain-containing protein [Chloroflexi bacterium]|nr:DUF3592 domain-containing protein [Chloroflexota bacterium]MCI0650060.1 DUF3592 domain-containing protein [Chloroflexota bacterium]MCI0729759.1 DUF3592 domain-containing protein [Chloroflexota bacterium]
MFISIFSSSVPILGLALILVLGLVFTLAFGGVGLWFAFTVARLQKAAALLQSWPSTSGQILAASLEPETAPGGRGTRYRPQIRYRYQVAGQTYEGSKIQFLEGATTLREAQARIAPYALGQAVTVFYNVNRPQAALLDRGQVNWRHSLYASLICLGVAADGFVVAGLSAWSLLV